MTSEYIIKYSGDRSISHNKLKSLIGPELYDSDEFTVSDDSDEQLDIMISGSDASRIAFSKLVDYLLSIADSLKIRES
jgi:hypothetical protein